MLEVTAWNRLLKGLIDATNRGKLTWTRDNKRSSAVPGIGSFGIGSSGIFDRLSLRASTKATTYQLEANSLGRSPFEITVDQGNGEPIESLSSTSNIADPEAFELNRQLERLFRTASSSIVDSEALVEKLLGEIESD